MYTRHKFTAKALKAYAQGYYERKVAGTTHSHLWFVPSKKFKPKLSTKVLAWLLVAQLILLLLRVFFGKQHEHTNTYNLMHLDTCRHGPNIYLQHSTTQKKRGKIETT